MHSPSLPPSASIQPLADHVLSRAAALGRRDGLEGQPGDLHGEMLDSNLGLLARQATAALGAGGIERQLLLMAIRQCYAAGHAHGADVRRQNTRRGAAA